MKRLVLLGGGHAHLHVLQAFAAEPPASTQLTLVSPFAAQTYSGMVPGFVAGHYALADCLIPLAPRVAAAKGRFHERAATAVDASARRVTLSDGSVIGYDVLSIDTGPVMLRGVIPGADEHALFVRPIEHFTRLWGELQALAGEAALGVVVIGGGAAGVELAMAIAHALGERARISLVVGAVPLLASHSPGLRARARRALQRLRITVLEEACVAISAHQVELASGLRLACDAPVLAIGTAAPAWLAGSGLALDDSGFVATGATLQSTSHADVFAAGDVASRIDAPHAKSGVHAVRAGPPLAFNLRRFVAGGALQPHQPQRRTLNLLACGERYAIASWGDWAFEGRWVWRWKDRIDRAFVARHRGEGR